MVRYLRKGDFFYFYRKFRSTVWYGTLGKGVFLDKIQEYHMVLYPQEGGIFREKVKKVKAHPFQKKQSRQS
jgi:hypothetical protein